MTDSDLLAAIVADPTAKAMADVGDDSGCAARMTAVLPPVLSPRFVTERGIFDAFADSADAEAVMTALENAAKTNPVVARALNWLAPNNGGIDLANAQVRAMLDQMAAGALITQAQADTLKALADQPASVSADDVSRAYLPNRPNGRLA